MSWNGIPFTHCIIPNDTAAGGHCHPRCSLLSCNLLENDLFNYIFLNFSQATIFYKNCVQGDSFDLEKYYLSRITHLHDCHILQHLYKWLGSRKSFRFSIQFSAFFHEKNARFSR